MPEKGQLRVGTSGYSYKEWKGSFYPEKLPDREMLSFYAEEFSTVEINFSFYQMPKEALLLQWASQVPGSFQFAMKANQQITHLKRLRNCQDTLKRFLEVCSVLQEGDHLGPVLVQLPPNFKFDVVLLDEFLSLRPPAFLFAFEVRHASWYTEETYELLRRHKTALVFAETDKETSPEVLTTEFAYVRLRRETYTPAVLKVWREKFDRWRAAGTNVYVYCKHDTGDAPKYARQLLGSESAETGAAEEKADAKAPAGGKRKNEPT